MPLAAPLRILAQQPFYISPPPPMLYLSETYPQKRAFITGAASGFGLALATALAEDGWTIGLADVDEAALPRAVTAVRAHGGQALSFLLDVTDAEAFDQTAEAFVNKAGAADLVINNAGIATAGLAEEVPLEDWRATIDIDLMGVVHGCRAFIPHMKRAGGGHLINVASIAAVAAAPRMAPYNAAKAGVLALSETLYAELTERGIGVSVVMPEFFQTNIGRSMRGDAADRAVTEKLLERSGLTADEVARAALDQAGRGTLHVLYPLRARLIWHLKRLLPAPYMRYMARRFVKIQRSMRRYEGAEPERQDRA